MDEEDFEELDLYDNDFQDEELDLDDNQYQDEKLDTRGENSYDNQNYNNFHPNFSNNNHSNQLSANQQNQPNQLAQQNQNTLNARNNNFPSNSFSNKPQQKQTNDGNRIQNILNKNKGKGSLIPNIFNNRNRTDTNSDEESEQEGEEKGFSAKNLLKGKIPLLPKKGNISTKKVDLMLKLLSSKKKIMIVTALIPVFVMLLIIMVVAAPGSTGQTKSEEIGRQYVVSGDDISVLLNQLIADGVCTNEEECKDTTAGKFYIKLKDVYDEYSNNDITLNYNLLYATISYERSGEEIYAAIDEIEALAEVIGKSNNENTNIDNWKKYLLEETSGYLDIYRSQSAQSLYQKEKIVRNMLELYEILNAYEDTSSGNEIISSGGTCTYNVKGKTISNIKVRLLQCGDGNRGEPIEGEELVDFEKYILGVVYAENGGGPTEALKTQAIAARSYSLMRGAEMHGAANLGINYEEGQWILSIRNCTEDQVYCDPDKGCWSNSTTNGKTVHSGYDASKAYSTHPMGENAEIRKVVSETRGQVVLDSDENILYTPFIKDNQDRWNAWANEGLDHFEIIKNDYPAAAKISSTCIAPFSDYSNWKQYDEKWGSIRLGNSNNTIKTAGCYITSIAIQMARSGTTINSNDFNPGILVNTLNSAGAFSTGGSLTAFSWQKLVPNFIYHANVALPMFGTAEQKANIIASYQNEGYYVIIRAKSKQHWVALDRVEGEHVYIFDPGSMAIDLWSRYPSFDVTAITVFKKTDLVR